jgi:hypothetical protein
MRSLLGLIVLIVGFVSGCSASSLDDGKDYRPGSHSTVTNGVCTPVAFTPASKEEAIRNISIVLDETYSFEHQGMIISALNTWRLKTNYTFEYTISCVGEIKSKANDNIWGSIIILNKDPGSAQGLGGYTYWAPGYIYADIIIWDQLENNIFERVVSHELGHAFNLSHDESPYTSIMKGTVSDTTEPQCQDIQAFCKNWGCDIACDPIPILKIALDRNLSVQTINSSKYWLQ